jgi:hypothetical protein
MTYTASLARTLFLASLMIVAPASSDAQDSASRDHAAHVVDADGWSWSADANVFAGFNDQHRQFADFSSWESQNWFMAAGTRRVGTGRLMIDTMLSLEPFTVGKAVFSGGQRVVAGGSPQLFQTGESFQGAPLVNYQHPHDLLMALGGTYRLERPRLTYVVGADLVGSPTLGPTAFMHRESARDNPQAPLTHHFLDSTHITSGVIRGGVEVQGFTFETSAFRGEEPDEHRVKLDRPRLNSWAGRVGWRGGSWQAQFSGGRLHEPEWFEPYDMTRLTASVAFDGSVGDRPLTAMIAWGENREFTPYRGVADNYLLEADFRATDATSLYGRIEKVRKEVLGLGYHPKGFGHPHIYSDIDAFTIGLVRDLPIRAAGRTGIGADITLYNMSPDMALYWAGSNSIHVFLRWRPNVSTQHRH